MDEGQIWAGKRKRGPRWHRLCGSCVPPCRLFLHRRHQAVFSYAKKIWARALRKHPSRWRSGCGGQQWRRHKSTWSLLPYVPYWKKRKNKKDIQRKSIAAKARGQSGRGVEMTLPSAAARTERSAGPRGTAAGRAGALRRPSPETQTHRPCPRRRPDQNNREHSPPLPIMRLTSFK